MNLMIKSQAITMSSREIAELTGKEKKTIHRDIKSMADQLGYGTDVYHDSKFGITLQHDGRGYFEMIYLDRKHTDCLLTGYSAKARMRVIERWHELESGNKLALPQTFAEALQLAADQAKLIEEAKPKVEFHDTVTQSEHTYKYQEAGKKIQQRPNKFVAWLRESGYIDKMNTPYQRYISQGLFKMHTGVNDHGHEYTQGRVTTKGLSYFTNKLEGLKL